LKKEYATIGNIRKHKTFKSQTNETIGNKKKHNLLSATENELRRFHLTLRRISKRLVTWILCFSWL